MNKAIFKYRLDKGEQTIHLPSDHKFLSVQLQNGEDMVWVALDPSAEKDVEAVVFGVMTGFGVPAGLVDNSTYLGTTVNNEAGFVLHWFLRYGM